MPGVADLSASEIAELLHELRAPLGGIEAMADLLAERPSDPAQQEIIRSLRASAAHLRGIADRGLAGWAGAEHRTEDRDLQDFLGEFRCTVEARTARQHLALALEMPSLPEGLRVRDAGALRQVLDNLIDNAVRLTAAGSIELVLAIEEDRVRFSVLDRGPGLRQAELDRLMAVGGTMPDRPGGAGLGLGIVGRLVSRHGGRLLAELRADGSGSRLSFTWPLTYRPPEARRQCLVLDDLPASRLVLRTILGHFGWSVHEAASVAEARHALAERSFDLLFADLRLAGETSAELIRELGKAGTRPFPIVLVSADEPGEGGLAPGDVDAALAKPISVRAVSEVLRQIDERAQVAATAA